MRRKCRYIAALCAAACLGAGAPARVYAQEAGGADGAGTEVTFTAGNDGAMTAAAEPGKIAPVKYEKGFKIHGLEKFKDTDGYYVFHAGTKFDEDGDIVTNGGRVLGVTAKGKDLKEARANAYKATEWINFANKYMRHDIGHAIDEA